MTLVLAERVAEKQQPAKGESRCKRKLHVVVLPYPAKGHSIPLLHFAKRLHSMDVVVTFVNPYSHHSKEHFRTLNGLNSSSMHVVSIGVPPPEGPGNGPLPYVKNCEDMHEAKGVLVNFFYELEHSYIDVSYKLCASYSKVLS